LFPTLLGIVPYAGLSFATFETLKAKYREANEIAVEGPISAPLRLLFGGIAGLFAQSATYPLDIVRKRMQVAKPGDPVYYRSLADAFSKIIQVEGVAGLYKGLSMNFIKGPVAVSTSFFINDRIRSYIGGSS
jgi:solute carrier family 25 protein 42